MRRRELRSMSAADIVAAVGDAPLDEEECRARLRARLAELGLDPVDWVRARVAVKLGRSERFQMNKERI